MQRRQLPLFGLLLLLIVFLGSALLYPIWLTLRGGFEDSSGAFTLIHIRSIFDDPLLRQGLVHALAIALGTTVMSMVIALPLAILSARYRFPLARALGALVLVPMILPPFVGAIGIQHLLGRSGALNALLLNLGVISDRIDFLGAGGMWAIMAIEALALYPIIYLNATAALANLDPALDEAAENVGAGPWRRLFQITLPLIRPGLFAGGTIVFIWSFTELGTPLLLDYQVVTPVQIFGGLKEMNASAQPYALTALMLALSVSIYVVGRSIFGRRAHAMYAKASIQAQPVPLRGVPAYLATGYALGVFAIAVLPHLCVILASLATPGSWYESILPQSFTLGHYESALSHPMAVGAIRNSLLLALAAMALDLIIGLCVGYLVVRTTLPLRGVLDALTMLPLAVPGLVMAFGYVAMTLHSPFGKDGPLSGFADILGAEPNPFPLLILAYAVRRLPYVVRATVAGLQQTSGELEEAALNLGASRFTAARTIIVPLISANLIAGGLMAFSFAMLEVSDSIILAQRAEHFPITKAIFVLFDRLGDGRAIASAMGVWGMAILTVTLLSASLAMGKRMGALFRV